MATTRKTARRGATAPSRRRPITAEDVSRMVGVGEAQMSPDGKSLLFVRKIVGARNAYQTSACIVDAAGTRAPRAITKGPKDIFPRWSPDGLRVAFVRLDVKAAPCICSVSAKGGAVRLLTTLPHGTVRDFACSPCGRRIAFSFRSTAPEWTADARTQRESQGLSTPPRVIDDVWYRLDGEGVFGGERFALHVLDCELGSVRKVFDRDTLGLFSWDWSPDGNALVIAANMHARAAWNPAASELLVVTLAAGNKQKIGRMTGIPAGPKGHPRWSPDGTHIAWAGRIGSGGMYGTDNVELFVHDLVAHKTRSLTAASDLCLMAATLSDSGEAAFEPQLRWFQDGSAIFFRAGWHGSGRVASVSVNGGAVAFHTEAGAEISLGTFSADGWRLACVRSTPTQPGEAHVLEVERSVFVARRVTHCNDAWIDTLDLVQPRERWLRAKDGHRVQCWSMRPRIPRRIPAILEVHGGPHAQYGLTFFHEFQLLCAQGYEVWFSNPRGSKGYGMQHTAAIRGAWGTKDWIDIQAVAKAMRTDAGIDRGRVGIMGGSYGGYMANWAVAHDNTFRAAISDRCVSNIVSHAGNSDHPEVPDQYWPGSAFDRPDALWRASPIAHFRTVRTPMLLIHSEGDLRCNIEQSEQIHTALCTLGVPTRFVRYPLETSHGMSRAGPPDMRIHRLHQITQWWKRWMAKD